MNIMRSKAGDDRYGEAYLAWIAKQEGAPPADVFIDIVRWGLILGMSENKLMPTEVRS